MKQHKQNFIRKIQIKNYKSIKDLTIEFHAGLNIIIGPNGTGKTNFVNAVNSVFTEKLHADLPIGFEFSFEFVNVDDEIIVWNGGVQEKILKNGANVKLKTRTYRSEATSKMNSVIDDSLLSDKLIDFFFMNGVNLLAFILLPFGYPTQLAYVNQAEGIEVSEEDGEDFGLEFYLPKIGYVYFYFGLSVLPLKLTSKTIRKLLTINNLLLKSLANFSPIQNCRISDGYTFQKKDKILIINHILLEFYINDTWLLWDKLSDGTKRLFYIISESLTPAILGGWLLIEEPELGIHPDQLYKLMDFLKEQSQHKQIIITTHSPDVLNILENNELHKIVVTRIDKQQGTLMHHLSPQKVKKAQSYMEDLSLKDFWVHSNLETLDETAEN